MRQLAENQKRVKPLSLLYFIFKCFQLRAAYRVRQLIGRGLPVLEIFENPDLLIFNNVYFQ